MIIYGKPFSGKELNNLKSFLNRMDLDYDPGIEYTVCILNDNYEIIGTGSVDQNVIKCVAIHPEYQGQGLSATIISNLVQYEFEKARTHIMIYTKPRNIEMFSDMGFYPILQTENVLFMENRQKGFQTFIQGLKTETEEAALQGNETVGAIVANCNPFTLGHRYLIEKALEQCDVVHFFVLSDNRGSFSAEERYEMVKEGVRDLPGVILHKASDYIISAATFPTYFFKDKAEGENANCRLDLELFAKKIAPELKITKRFVGTEPNCKVTKSYNEQMKQILPEYGITVEEIERKKKNDTVISASQVRKCIETKEFEQIKDWVPKEVFAYLKKLKQD